jgi:hypothetical protein
MSAEKRNRPNHLRVVRDDERAPVAEPKPKPKKHKNKTTSVGRVSSEIDRKRADALNRDNDRRTDKLIREHKKRSKRDSESNPKKATSPRKTSNSSIDVVVGVITGVTAAALAGMAGGEARAATPDQKPQHSSSESIVFVPKKPQNLIVDLSH